MVMCCEGGMFMSLEGHLTLRLMFDGRNGG